MNILCDTDTIPVNCQLCYHNCVEEKENTLNFVQRCEGDDLPLLFKQCILLEITPRWAVFHKAL